MVNDWKVDTDGGNVVIALFLDQRRAFETVDHEILLSTLEFYGVTYTVLDWFKSWLSQRTQQTKYDGIVSNKIFVNIGIPQCTPLSCILFVLYINRVVQLCDKLQIKLFSDDSLFWIVTRPENITEAIRIMNNEMNNIYRYLSMLKLKINTKKTVFMVIGSKYNLSRLNIPIEIVIGGERINRVTEIKYLGVMIDQHLDFAVNHRHVCKKIAFKTNFLMRNSKRLDQNTKLIYYK